MLIRTIDAKDYIEFKIKVVEEIEKESKALYNNRKEQYENSFFARLFRLKFDPGWDYYDWYHTESWLKELRSIRNKIEYTSKMEYSVIDSKELDDWVKGFYNWCKENDRPY